MTNRILDVSDLSAAFNRKALEHGVNFHIYQGEASALVGESGSGELTEVFAHPARDCIKALPTAAFDLTVVAT